MKEGEETGKLCPKCETPMFFEMSFMDQWSYTTGHYTTDYPIQVCPNCDYNEEYIEEREYERE